MRFSSGRGSTFSSHMMRSVLALALLMPLAACDTISDMNPFGSDDKYKPEIKPTVPAEVLYNQGLAYAQKSSWDDAAKKFAEVDKQYPFSNWSKKALILQTSAHYNAKNYDEAIATGRRYLGLYPAADDASYAAYMVAASYYNQIPDVTRDQERAEKALLALQEVVQRWPKSDYAEDARFKIQVARDQLAGREMDIGRFYLKKRNYTAAINRFRVVISQYQTTNQTEEALARLAEAYVALGILPEAQTAAAILGHNFPSGQWYADTYKLLQTRGLEPREDQGSWISKTFKAVGLG